jgi:hypothetical protein
MSKLEFDFEKVADKIILKMAWGEQKVERTVPINTTTEEGAAQSSEAIWNALFAMAWCMHVTQEQMEELVAKFRKDLRACQADELFWDMTNLRVVEDA